METNYQSAIDRVNRCKSIHEVFKLEKSLERLWEAGMFTDSEFQRIDAKLMNKEIELQALVNP